MHSPQRLKTAATCFLMAGVGILVVFGFVFGQDEVDLPAYFAHLDPDATLWYQHVQTLANPAFEGRAPGTRGMELAAEYIEFYLRTYSLRPPFPGPVDAAGNYRQTLTLDAKEGDRTTTANLAGVLPGKGRLKDEYLVIGGHYDHLGKSPKQPNPRGEAPMLLGADDNASGTAAVLILARRLAAVYREAPEGTALRSIIFAAFTAEERGRLGSRHFIRNPPVPFSKIKAMVNLDMIGYLRNDQVSLSGYGTAAQFPALLGEVLAKSDLQVITAPGSGASDQMSFLEAGIPALYVMTGGHAEIHQPADLASTLDPSGAARVIDLAEGIVQRLARQPEALSFVPQPDIGEALCADPDRPETLALSAPATEEQPLALPDSSAGRCVAAFIGVFNSGDSGRVADFEENCRSAAARAQRSDKDRSNQLKHIHDELGDLTLLRVVRADPAKIGILTLASRASAKWSVEFEFEDQPPHGLVTLRFHPYSPVGGADGPKPGGSLGRPPERVGEKPNAVHDQPSRIPDTPGGRCVTAYLKAFNSGNDDQVRDFEDNFRAASKVKERSLQDRIDQIHQIQDDLGQLSFLRLISTSPAQIAILARSSRRGEAWTLAFEFEDRPPHGLVALRISPFPGQEDAGVFTEPLDEALRKDTIKQIGDLLREGYVNPEIGKKMADVLAEHEAAGLYKEITSAADLAQRLTVDVLAVYRDNHLSIAPITGTNSLKGCGADKGLQDNYGFRKAELLSGNIGYIKFDMFQSSEEARDAAAAALAAVAGCDALIFDLRDNVGGSPRMVEFIASYLFNKPTHLDSFFDRLSDKTMEIWTLQSVPGRRFPNDLPVYILTSPSTASAAEGFAYDLKHLGRAIVVGARTAGAAHMVTERVINGRFLINLPYLREINPVTKGNWEGTGVEPDIKVPASEALERALKHAADKVPAKRQGAFPASPDAH